MTARRLASAQAVRYQQRVDNDQRDPEVPRLPRGRGLVLSGSQLMKVLITAVMLIAVIALQRPCANSVGSFFAGFDEVDAGATKATEPAPAAPGTRYIELRGMSDEQVRQAYEELRRDVDADAGVMDATEAKPGPDAVTP
jgi:hypothetical protein